MRSLVWIGVLGLTACTNDLPVEQPDDVPRTCIATVTGGGTNERVEAELSSAGHPTVMEQTRDGAMQLRWTFAYDTDGRLITEEHDYAGSGHPAPDGVVELVRSVEHSATTAIQRWGAPGGPTGETATSTLDAEERVVRYDSGPSGFRTFQLNAAGLIE